MRSMSSGRPTAATLLRRRRFSSRLGRVLLSVALMLVSTELALRLIDPFSFGETRETEAFAREILHQVGRHTELIPGTRAMFRGHEVLVGSHGWRTRETPQAKPAHLYRVLVVGDSVAFGWGVAESDCFPRVLERLLAEYPPPEGFESVEVINAGVPGAGLADIFLSLKQSGLAYEPDLVLMTLVGNDVPWRLDDLDERSIQGTLLPSWVRGFDLGRILQVVIDNLSGIELPSDYEVGRDFNAEGLAEVDQALRRLALLCEGTRLVLVDTIGEPGDIGLSQIVASCARLGLPRIKAYLSLENYLETYALSAYDPHPNARGHRDIAEMIMSWCATEVLD